MSRYSPGKYGTVLDMIHIIIGVLITILAVITFVNPDNNKMLFPVIFFLGAVLNLVTGRMYIKMYPRQKKKRQAAIGYIIAGILIMILCVVSAVSLW
ncbi:MAG: DUF6637 family protein [Candidatus Avilachnospira sp.]|jgi:heme/copper-type cytochrome/quinol oxidase subunit 4